MDTSKPILVTGATGFIGAHIVDNLLSRGLKVRGTTRSLSKGQAMLDARPQYKDHLEFVQIADFEKSADFTKAVEGVGAVIHTASPLNYSAKDNEKELVLPAIRGVRAVLDAAAAHPDIKRVVITSSFASVLDANRKAPPYFTYTGADWNPITYEESIDNSAPAFIAYRGSKKFAELEAWNFVKEKKPSFDIVTLCPPMTFGPIVHPVKSVEELNESNANLWSIAKGNKLPVSRVPFWIDVRDLAKAHVEALLRPEVGGKRYVPASPARFSYGEAAKIMVDRFESLKASVQVEEQAIDESHGLDGETAAKELGYEYHSFQETVTDLISQVLNMNGGN
ncbi:hypothetical protein jhhlp_004452 [Lomentospora prolificans]|uniref:NAD-dependent epimerase/dehydratase domain-containing protein n=1 Tax=Lomentospora prolificans TaxID=41688 RepID=A0A2N3NBL7_9PEZI|nr:hypothetical protein jhhlp_004452 [Lomentospora prolificans]